MQYKRIVISGGPSSGKTTLINELEKEGYYCFQEVSRELIKEAKAKGIDQPFLSNPEQFNDDLMNARLQQFKDAAKVNKNTFYDRGVHDIVGYMYYGEQDVSAFFNEACISSKYDKVFLLPPWDAIHIQDNERYESFEQAIEIYKSIHKAYKDYGFQVIEVPKGTVSERKLFILRNV